MSPLCLLLMLMGLAPCFQAAEILGLFHAVGRSQWILSETYLKALAARGHHITVVTNFPSNNPPENWTEILINSVNYFPDDFNFFDFTDDMQFASTILDFVFGDVTWRSIMEDEKFQQLYRSNRKFDLVVMEPIQVECFTAMAYKFNASLVSLASWAGMEYLSDMVGNPNPYAYVPSIMFSFTDHMTFTQRLVNTVCGMFMRLGRELIYLPKADAVLKEYLNDPNMPSIQELERRTSLLMVNDHVSLGYPRPMVPNMIAVGGLHVKPPKKLPQDLQKYLDDSKDGVIYFSLGSNVKSSQMPADKLEAFLKTFAKLKQRVLWKWETDSLPGQPPNVKIGKWLPQSDILAHKNVLLFITHGGLLSTQEATARGVPVIGIPIMADQGANMENAQNHGFAIRLDFRNITSKTLEWAIQEILTVPRYRENARRLSRIFHDRPRPPLEEAVYWTEYVLRHNGAPHMRSAALDLSWPQYLLLDVVGALLAAITVVLFVVYKAITKLYRLLRRAPGKPSKKITKTE